MAALSNLERAEILVRLHGEPDVAPARFDKEHLVIQNPGFFVAFFGTALLSLALLASVLLGWLPGGAAWTAAGALLYLAGIIAVTIVVNVPMNDALAAVDPANSEAATLWKDYLSRWMMWNHVRTAAGVLSLRAFMLALR